MASHGFRGRRERVRHIGGVPRDVVRGRGARVHGMDGFGVGLLA